MADDEDDLDVDPYEVLYKVSTSDSAIVKQRDEEDLTELSVQGMCGVLLHSSRFHSIF